MEMNNTLTYGTAGASMGPWGAAAGAGVGLVMDIMGSNAAKKQAQARAAALKKKADARLLQGKQQSDLELAQGGANQTSEFSSMLGRGVSRNASIVNESLDEISNRAKYAATQAMASAQADADVINSDAADTISNANDAQRASQWNMAGTLLSQGTDIYNAKYGKYGSAERKVSNSSFKG